MTVLDTTNRVVVWATMMQRMSDGRESTALTKAQLRAAVDAIDDWVEANAAAFNSAIPQPARGALTTAQKARLLMLIAEQRYGVG